MKLPKKHGIEKKKLSYRLHGEKGCQMYFVELDSGELYDFDTAEEVEETVLWLEEHGVGVADCGEYDAE